MSVGAIDVESVASEEVKSSNSLSMSATFRNSGVDNGREGSVTISTQTHEWAGHERLYPS